MCAHTTLQPHLDGHYKDVAIPGYGVEATEGEAPILARLISDMLMIVAHKSMFIPSCHPSSIPNSNRLQTK